MRYFIEFAYNGTNYHGWQLQPAAITVQKVLTDCLTTLFREPIDLVAAGRTDAGVHAKKMYAHFDIEKDIHHQEWIQKINSFLPEDITVFRIFRVHDDAHARFDAIARTYEYHLHTFKNSFLKNLSWYHFRPLDIDAMNKAAQILLEYDDFECFSKTHTDVFTYQCKITSANWSVTGNQMVFTITANRFLRNMVRAIVGTLIQVGLHKIAIADIRKIIESKNRSQAGFSVPAHGLYLTEVQYPYITNEKI